MVALLGGVAGLFVTLDVGGADGTEPGSAPTSSPTPDAGSAPPERRRRSEPLVALDEEIAGRQRLAAARADAWLDLEVLASLYLDRQRLTGEYSDFASAERALRDAFARSPSGAGPFLIRASLNYAIHRLAPIEPDLVAVEDFALPTPLELEAVRAMRADVAFQLGDYDTAHALYQEQLAESRSAANLVALAQYRWRTGDVPGARTLLDEAELAAAHEPEGVRAWLALVRGLLELDGARVTGARRAFERGLDLAPGWWQIEEHLAQVALLDGDTEGALSAYEALVDRVPSPELMDAIAVIHDGEGRMAEMLAWRERARAGHEARLALYPEAAAGHALDHFLELEDEPERLVALAEANRDARPGGEAQTKLAMAYLRAGRLESALEVVALLESTPWSTPASHAISALVLERAGDPRAAEHSAAAEALAPGAMARTAWLRTAP